MKRNNWGRWLPALLLAACNGKLSVGDPTGSGGSAAASGAGWTAAGAAEGGALVYSGGAPEGGALVHSGGAAEGGALVYSGGAPEGGALVYAGGVGGTAGSPAAPGALGQPCIPGRTALEAQSSVAEALVTTLDRCLDGLMCGASAKCVSIPDCPQVSGPCVIRRANVATDSGSFAGAGGTTFSGAAGDGGIAAPPVGPEFGVRAITADGSHLYWVEYGTRDKLGNYQNNGVLFSYSFSDHTTKALDSTLPGPNGLGITSGHAYVFSDGAPLVGAPSQLQLFRLPLSGGVRDAVQIGTLPGPFVAVGDTAYWYYASTWFTSSGAAAPSVFLTVYTRQGATDGTSLYYSESDIRRAEFTGGSPQTLVSPAYPFALSSDTIYGLEPIYNPQGLVLSKVSKSGGAWQRFRALGSGAAGRLQIVGDRYIFDSNENNVVKSNTNLTTGSLTTSDPPVRILELSVRTLPWTVTADALYWSDGRAIYQRLLSDLP